VNSIRKNIPRYRQLYEILRKQIVDGIYKEGDILPSENELCAVHNLTRPTVRQALSALVNEGFIRKHQGKGSIVHKLPKGIGILSIAGTTSALGVQNLRSEILIKPYVRPWDDDFFFRLSDIEKQSGCIYMERLRYFNEIPIFYDVNYIPNINLPRLTSRSFKDKSLFDILRSVYQIEIKGGEQKLRAIKACARIAEYLNIMENDPVLHLERKFETNRQDTTNQAVYGIF